MKFIVFGSNNFYTKQLMFFVFTFVRMQLKTVSLLLGLEKENTGWKKIIKNAQGIEHP